MKQKNVRRRRRRLFLCLFAIAGVVLVLVLYQLHKEDIDWERYVPYEEIEPFSYSDTMMKNDDFIKVNGTELESSDGSIYQIKGIGFGNACWSNHPDPVKGFNEDSYAELEQLGFNTVRYYLNYGMFELDQYPYHYNKEAFEWLDLNVLWAKKHNIKIIFNMHIPQGGYQSTKIGLALWSNEEEEQERVTALWKVIAKRYANVDAVLGYGLLNEPYMIYENDDVQTIAQWETLANKMTEAIRQVDKKHVLFVEQAIGGVKEDGSTDYSLNDYSNFIKVNDPENNVVLEAHFYTPTGFTHMTTDKIQEIYNYPNEDLVITDNYRWVVNSGNSNLNTDTIKKVDGWYYLETKLLTVPDDSVNIISAGFAVKNAGGSGDIYIDDIKIDEYDENGKFVKTIATHDFSIDMDWNNFYSSDGKGSCSYETEEGHDQAGCVKLSGVGSYGMISASSPLYFHAKRGYSYKVSAWAKADGVASGIAGYPIGSFGYSDTADSFDSSYIKRYLTKVKATADSLGMPLFLGEFGTLAETYNGRGGDAWVKDVITACIDDHIGFSYHLYQGGNFALYRGSEYELPSVQNPVLYKAFEEVLGKTDSSQTDEEIDVDQTDGDEKEEESVIEESSWKKLLQKILNWMKR